VEGDVDRLQQVASNLLNNALKFTTPGGRIEVRAEERGDQVRISVSDTGAGISPDLLPVIFEAFRQGDATAGKRAAGLGLGLALVRELVQLHGGRVTAESPGQGRGSTFIVELPRAAAPSASRSGSFRLPGIATAPRRTA
jgi:signal transduction histidine kinase